MLKREPTTWDMNTDNVIGLAQWLDSECKYFDSPAETIRYFDRPYNLEREYQCWRLWKYALTDEHQEFIVEKMIDGHNATYIQLCWEERLADDAQQWQEHLANSIREGGSP